MTTATATNPGQRYERAFTNRQDALERAEEYEAKGWTHMAALARHQAAGHKATMTTIARTNGWL